MCDSIDEQNPHLRNLGHQIAKENSTRGIKEEKGAKIEFSTNFTPGDEYNFCSSFAKKKEDTEISSINPIDEQHFRVIM